VSSRMLLTVPDAVTAADGGVAAAAARLRLDQVRDGAGVFGAAREILADLLGCAHFGVFTLDLNASLLSLHAGTGTALAHQTIVMAPGAIRDAGAVGVVPLRHRGVLSGAILLFDLPAEKSVIDPAEQAVLRAVAQRLLEVLPPATMRPGTWRLSPVRVRASGAASRATAAA
jgi:hypothetical protein